MQAVVTECCVLLQASRPGPEENRCMHTLSEVSTPVEEGLGRRVSISAGLVVPWVCAAIGGVWMTRQPHAECTAWWLFFR